MSAVVAILAGLALMGLVAWAQNAWTAYRSRRHHRLQDGMVSFWDRFF